MKHFGKVGVLMGGRSCEREISLLSGKGVLQALLSAGVDAHGFDPATQSLADLAAQRFDRVFIALHGRYGEDGTIQGALELLGIPYTGSGVMASALAMDKIFTKRMWIAQRLATPRYQVITAATALESLCEQLGFPVMIKPAHEGSTLGLSKVSHPAQLKSAYELAAQYDDVVLAEEFIAGRELTVGILELGSASQATLNALPIVEIIAPAGNYDYHHKYFSDATQYVCPAPIDWWLTQKIHKLAVDAFRAIACTGWGRVDVMLRHSDQEPFLLEVNTSPGMTSHSLLPMAAQALGITYQDLCLQILATAQPTIKTALPLSTDEPG